MKLRIQGVILCLASMFCGLSVLAQTAGTGALQGTVMDSTGAVVPNATVTIISGGTGQVRTTTTGNSGSYQFGLFPPGNYYVKIEDSGFKPIEIPYATVSVTETAVATGFGNIGQGNVMGPGQQSWDKMTKFRESMKTLLQFRAEFFNAFNHPIFSMPEVLNGKTNPAHDVSNADFGEITSTGANLRLI